MQEGAKATLVFQFTHRGGQLMVEAALTDNESNVNHSGGSCGSLVDGMTRTGFRDLLMTALEGPTVKARTIGMETIQERDRDIVEHWHAQSCVAMLLEWLGEGVRRDIAKHGTYQVSHPPLHTAPNGEPSRPPDRERAERVEPEPVAGPGAAGPTP